MKRLLLAAAAISCLVTPTLSAAQDRAGPRGGEGRGAEMRRDGGGAPPNVGQIRRGVPNPNFQGGQDRQGQNRQRPDFQGQRQERPDFAQRQDRQGGGDRSDAIRPDTRAPQADGRRDGDRFDSNRFENRGDRRFDNRNDGRFDNRGDGRFGSRSDPRFNDRNNNRFDSRGPVFSRSNPNWWRGRPEFRSYVGPRNGFWFLPSYGYIRPDARFYNYAWRSGDFVPRIYQQYVVVDPFIYGLDWPPPGFQWVYLGRDIVLMDIYSGRIVQVFNGYF